MDTISERLETFTVFKNKPTFACKRKCLHLLDPKMFKIGYIYKFFDLHATEKENVYDYVFLQYVFFYETNWKKFQTAPIGLKLSRKLRLGESFRMVPYTRF